MNALPLPQPPESPKRRTRRAKSNVRQHRQQQTRLVAAEATVKIGVNVVISSAAIAALAQLLPFSAIQQTKLKEIQTEVKTAQNRVTHIKAEFNRYFDPQQVSTIVQEQTNLTDPNRRVVVWQDPTPAKSAQLP